MMAETGVVRDIEVVETTGPYELVNLGLAPNLGINYNSAAPAGLTGDHTTLAAAYTSQSIGFAPPNIVKPIRGFRMPHGVKSVFYYLMRVPLGTTFTTGITFEIVLAVDPITSSADITGTKGYFDIVGMKMNTSVGAAFTANVTPDDFILSTTTCIAAQTAALPTALGAMYLHVMQVPSANLGTGAVSEWFLVRLRRLGDHQLDTNTGNLLMVTMSAYGY